MGSGGLNSNPAPFFFTEGGLMGAGQRGFELGAEQRKKWEWHGQDR